MILKKKFIFKINYLILLIITLISFVSGVLFHDAKLAYHLKQTIIKKTLVSKNLLNNFFSEGFPEIKLDIPFRTQNYLEKNLVIATKYNDINYAENSYKKANVTVDGKTYNSEIRLKGLTNFHRLDEKKSYKIRIKTSDNGLTPTIFGFSRFNLMNPKRRSNEKEWLFRKVARDEGLIERRYDFVNVVINGKKKGSYSIEENFSKEFFEFNKIKPAPIISIDNNKIAGAKNFNNCCGHIWINDFNFSPMQSRVKIFEDKNFNSQYNYAKKNLVDFLSGYIEPQKIINFDKFAKFLALADIFGGWHGNETSNLRLYFNPYNQLLEPIPDDMFDEPRDMPSRDFAIFKIRNIVGYSIFYEKLFSSNTFLEIYYNYLKKFSDTDYINNILNKYKKDLENIEKKLSKDNLYFKNLIEDHLVQNSILIQEFINPNYPIEIINLEQGVDNKINIDLQNNFYFPIELKSINFSGNTYYFDQTINPKRISLNSVFEGGFFHILKKPKRTKISLKLLENQQFSNNAKIAYTIGNSDLKTSVLNDFNPPQFEEITISSLNNLQDQLKIDYELKTIEFINDRIEIDQSIFFPKNLFLILDKNVEIHLNKNTNLIIESNIISKEDSNSQINFIAKGENCIIFKNNKIKLKRLEFKGFSNCKSNGSYLTGGVNFYKSNLNLDYLIAKSNQSGDDLVNIIKSEILIENLYLENSLYDGLDIDYSEGNIINLKCFNCGKGKGGDGVDLSHSNLFIENIVVTNSLDKGLSIGENTNVNIRNLNIKDANVCLANKDGSYTKIKNAFFENCNIGLAAFNKKNYYDYSKIEISVPNFKNNKFDILRDKNNKIIIGGWQHSDPSTIDNDILKKIYE